MSHFKISESLRVRELAMSEWLLVVDLYDFNIVVSRRKSNFPNQIKLS